MGQIGIWGIVVIAAVIVLLFGARRLPDMARGLGRSSREFKDALAEAPEDFRRGAEEAGDEPRDVPSARELELERELENERARRREAAP